MNKAFVREPDQTSEYCPRCGAETGEIIEDEDLTGLPQTDGIDDLDDSDREALRQVALKDLSGLQDLTGLKSYCGIAAINNAPTNSTSSVAAGPCTVPRSRPAT